MKNKFKFKGKSIGLFVVGILLIAIGYIFMARGDITISPILLTVAYVVVFPPSPLIFSSI